MLYLQKILSPHPCGKSSLGALSYLVHLTSAQVGKTYHLSVCAVWSYSAERIRFFYYSGTILAQHIYTSPPPLPSYG